MPAGRPTPPRRRTSPIYTSGGPADPASATRTHRRAALRICSHRTEGRKNSTRRSAHRTHNASRGDARYTMSSPFRRTRPHVAQHVSRDTTVNHRLPADDPDRLAPAWAAAIATFLILFLSRCLNPIAHPFSVRPRIERAPSYGSNCASFAFRVSRAPCRDGSKRLRLSDHGGSPVAGTSPSAALARCQLPPAHTGPCEPGYRPSRAILRPTSVAVRSRC